MIVSEAYPNIQAKDCPGEAIVGGNRQKFVREKRPDQLPVRTISARNAEKPRLPPELLDQKPLSRTKIDRAREAKFFPTRTRLVSMRTVPLSIEATPPTSPTGSIRTR